MVSDEALYEALLGGDLRAFDALYARYERPLFGFIRKQLANLADAEDVLHETFLAILRDRSSGRSVTSLKAWLFQIARNLCLNRHRSAHRAAHVLEAELLQPRAPDPHPDGAISQRQTHEALESAVARLPSELSDLFHLRTRGLSYREIAEVLSVPLGTVKSRLHQMVSHLREELER